uniref:Protein-L-isoaspartate(D-aspartate) O-methyltransferase n=1 Tax=Sus scrofa TaxID=9823 RepID=A0A4X1VQB1_PIG
MMPVLVRALPFFHNLRKNGIIKTDKVFEVMLATDRSHYAKCNPYMDSPQSIGFQATISAPHMHAYALELLFDQLHEGAKALDVGSGSGILTACFARMVGPSGKVIGIDHIKELVDDSINNVRKDDPMLLSSGRVQLVGEYQKALKISSLDNFFFLFGLTSSMWKFLGQGLNPSHSSDSTGSLFFFFFCLFVLLGPHLWHMEVPRLGVQSRSCSFRPQPRPQQCQILNPLSEARDRTCNLMVSSQIVSAALQQELPTLDP